MSTPFRLRILDGVPGSGKSYRLRQQAEENGGRYVFAYPSIALLEEQAKEFRKSDRLRVIEAHSKSKGKGSVGTKLAAASDDVYSQGWSDVVVLTTHESLMSCDFSEFQGWHFCIDEAPTAVQSGKINSAVSAKLYDEHFGLKAEPNSNWHNVYLKNKNHRWTQIAQDNATRHAAEFFKCASRDFSTLVDTSEWNVDSFQWVSCWSPFALRHIAKAVTIAGASYLSSLGGKIALLGREYDRVQNNYSRSKYPKIIIEYFTEGHEGSSHFWSTSQGRKCLVAVCNYLSDKVENLGYWSGNEVVRILFEHRLSGEMISPKSAGLNSYDHCNSCAYIYSSKPTPQDEALKSALGFTDEEIIRAREFEDIFQFIFRGAIRRRDFDGDYNIYLYSLGQAQRLKEMLENHGLTDIDLLPLHEAGILYDSGPERKAIKLADEKIASSRTGKAIKRSSQKRAERRLKQSQSLPPKKRGRPRKSS